MHSCRNSSGPLMATVEQKRNAVVPIGDKVQLWFVICNAWSFISWAGSGQQNPLDYSVAIQLFRNRTLVHGISQHFENEDWAVCFSWNPFGSPCHQTKPCWKIRELAIGAKCNSCHDTDPWRAGEGFLINRLYIYIRINQVGMTLWFEGSFFIGFAK